MYRTAPPWRYTTSTRQAMQARSRREYDDAVTREGDHNKRKKKPHKYTSMLHVMHE